MDRRNFVNLAAAIAAITVFGFTLGLMFPLLSLIMEKRGIGADLIGYNAAMQPLGIVLAVFTIPTLVRRFGAKAAVIGAALLAAAVVLAYPFFPVFWWWFGLRILHGFFVATLFSISEAWVVRFAEGPYRSRLLALYVSVLAASFGGGPILITITGIDGMLPFVIGAAILVLATLPIFFVRDEIIDSADEEPLSVLGFARKAPMLLLAVSLFALIDAANLGFLPVYGVKKGMDQETAALVLTAFIVGNMVLQFPVGWLADHFSKRMVMAGCGIVTASACALIPLSFETWALWPILTVAGAASAGIYTVALAELGERFSGHDLVTGTASFATTWGLGAILGSLLAGWSIEAFGPDGLPYALAMVFAVCLLGAIANSVRKPA
ncbi:MAG: MFS transporter [Rhizobiales bacterium]|nr:MFS transporter [Hyphomicrobiales bacterium]